MEVWLGLSWEPACGAFWDSWASEAVCRALGCGGAWEATPPTLPSLEPPPGPGAGNTSEATNATLTLAPAVRCTSAEWQLCKVVEHVCDRNETPAKVTCAGTAHHPCLACPTLRPSAIAAHSPPQSSTLDPSLTLWTSQPPAPPPSQTQLVSTLEDSSTASFPALSKASDLAPKPLSLLDLQFDHLGPQS